MKAYQQILLTTDLTKLSEEVARKAVNLAGHFNAQITLLHVIQRHPEDFQGSVDTFEELMETNRTKINTFVKAIPIKNTTPMLRLSEDSIENEIIEVAKEIKANLIIIGSYHGDEVTDDNQLNINIVKEQAMCDVLVVHPDQSKTA
ncbi:universal stress protein [Leucothrix arctica]|uniref:Universal stress protein n=1 Tax=Leucothrix arctica TaxID=1481894 RepID=A0A317C5D6_9GAMM|nr:universal stress protein [Leucothrix arctica]PWQ93834.1 hypothetical protein DKT75_19725 [Leucothrix arctica]